MQKGSSSSHRSKNGGLGLFLNQQTLRENNTNYIYSTSISSVIVCFTRAKKTTLKSQLFASHILPKMATSLRST